LSKNRRSIKRKVRRLKSKYLFFKSSLDEMNDLLPEYDLEWNRDRISILKAFSSTEKNAEDSHVHAEESLSKCKVRPASEQEKESKSEKLEDEKIESLKRQDAPGWAKDLYKQIAKKTHPDILDGDDSLLAGVFQRAAAIMQKGDYSELVDLCIDLDISINSSSDKIASILYDRIKGIKAEIVKIEGNPAWVWGESFGLPDLRLQIAKALLKDNGVDSPGDIEIADLIFQIEN
tara:strand:- start:205 stop:903 length:699 start_codon:yes stop_codon:yes gene_type:complete